MMRYFPGLLFEKTFVIIHTVMYWKGVNLYSSGETSATGGDFGSAFIWQSGLEFFPVETGIDIR